MVQVHVVPADPATAVPTPTEDVGKYQAVRLDLETGEFRYTPRDWRKDWNEEDRRRRADGVSLHWSCDWLPVGPRVEWIIESGFDDHTVDPPNPLPYLEIGEINALLDELRPAAQAFADAMLPVPGRPGRFDFTAAAAAANRAIARRLHRRRQPIDLDAARNPHIRDITEVADLYDGFDDALRTHLYVATSLDWMSDEDIARAAVDFGRGFIDERLPGLRDALGLAPRDKDRSDNVYVLGTTAFLCGLREQMAEGRSVVDAERWFDHEPIPAEVADLHNCDLPDWALTYNKDIAHRGVYVVGLVRWAQQNRRTLREQVRRQLARLGREAAEAEQAARSARQRRNALALRVLSWDDDSDTDKSVGKLARLSHTAIGKLRRAADGGDDTD